MLKTTLVLHFFSEMCTKHCKVIRPPPKAITWDNTPQSIKLGGNEANTVVRIHRTGKTDEGNSTCGALFPAVTISFGIQLARFIFIFFSLSLSLFFFLFFFFYFLFFLSFVLSLFFLCFFLFLSLSLSSCGKFPSNNVIRWRVI